MSETDPRQVLINLAASATLADHMGDMWNYINEALDQIGIKPPQEILWEDDSGASLAKWLATNHGATTVYGTDLLHD